MMEKNFDNDTAKELLTVLSSCDDIILSYIPEELLKNLSDFAADSTKEFYIDKNKSLKEQKLTEECKDLLSFIYYTYVTTSSDKKEILNAWLENEN